MNAKGISFIEILVCIALFLICVGGLTALIAQSTVVSHTAYYTYLASSLARNRIEWVGGSKKSNGYQVLEELPEHQVDLIDFQGNPGEDFERKTEINYSSEQTKVKVTVDYKAQELNVPISVTLVSLFYPY